MTTARHVLRIARDQLGTIEGPGSNNVKYNTWYYGRQVAGDQFAWCDVFVGFVADAAGAAGLFPRSAYCPSSVAAWKRRGAWGSTPHVGAQIFYQWPAIGRPCHTGIVEAVRSDGSVIAIEGNTDAAGGRTGGRVMRQVRRSHIVGYGYPGYDGAEPTSGTAGDGGLGPRICRALQSMLGVTADGELGPVTARAWQRHLGVASDGQVGPLTLRALQQHLTSRGYPCAVDGELGPQTIGQLQRALDDGRC